MRIKTLIGSIALILMSLLGEDATAERQKYALERFELDQLGIAFVLLGSDCQEPMAEILDPDGFAYTVKIGDFMGRHHGKIISIEKRKILLTEIRKDEDGEWVERDAVLHAP